MKTIFTLLLSFLTVASFAQRKFVSGYYITKQGERVEAQINDQNWDRNPTFIEITKGSEVMRLGVAELTSFGLSTGDAYYAYSVEVDKSPTKLNAIEPNSQPIIEREMVFLKAIVKGAASLFYLKDANAKEHFYVQNGDEEPAELIYRTIKHESEGKSGYTKLPIYRGMLSAKLTDCPKVTQDVAKLPFTQKALKELLENYNLCVSGSTGTYQAVQLGTIWNFSVAAGMGNTSLSFSSAEHKSLTNADFNSTHYLAGVSALATLPRGRGKWAIQGNLFYRPLKAESESIERSITSNENYTRTTTSFDMAYLDVNAMVRYRFLDGKLRPFLSAGLSNNLLVSDNSKQTVFTKFYTSENTRERKPLEETRKHEQALLFGLGVEMKKLAAELKMENGNGFSPYSGLKSSRNTFSFMLSYNFK